MINQDSNTARFAMTAVEEGVLSSLLETPAPPSDWRLPLSLRLLAYLLVTVGILGIVETCLAWFVFREGGINFAFVGLLLGWGLFRFREWARVICALLCLLTMLFAGAVGVSAIAAVVFRGNPLRQSINSGLLGPELLTLAMSLLFVISLTWWKSLYWCEIDAKFQTPAWQRVAWTSSGTPIPTRRLRFGLGTLLMAMFVVALVLARITSDDVRYKSDDILQLTNVTGPGPRRLQSNQGVEYGVRTNRFGTKRAELTYVVISNDVSWSNHVEREGSPNRSSVWLRTPNGSRIVLPGKHQLYELVDGQVRTHDKRITLGEFLDFAAKNRQRTWSLDALVKHAEAMRAK